MISSRQHRPFHYYVGTFGANYPIGLSIFLEWAFFIFFSSFQSYYSTVFRMCRSFENTVIDKKEKHNTRRLLPPLPNNKGQ